MIIIGFSKKSSKILPNIFCKNFKHCAVIVRDGTEFTLYQFVSYGHIEKIRLRVRDMKMLQQYGWCFVYVPCDLPRNFPRKNWTCVNMAKDAIKMRAPFIQTPDALYRAISE
ncbi:MAG: hypothetical protein J5714_01765 [Alphaproteobacteria bacterium]|nr:hypothetical protein [Alphaproteobacteria bacterium]